MLLVLLLTEDVRKTLLPAPVVGVAPIIVRFEFNNPVSYWDIGDSTILELRTR